MLSRIVSNPNAITTSRSDSVIRSKAEGGDPVALGLTSVASVPAVKRFGSPRR